MKKQIELQQTPQLSAGGNQDGLKAVIAEKLGQEAFVRDAFPLVEQQRWEAHVQDVGAQADTVEKQAKKLDKTAEFLRRSVQLANQDSSGGKAIIAKASEETIGAVVAIGRVVRDWNLPDFLKKKVIVKSVLEGETGAPSRLVTKAKMLSTSLNDLNARGVEVTQRERTMARVAALSDQFGLPEEVAERAIVHVATGRKVGRIAGSITLSEGPEKAVPTRISFRDKNE